MNRSGFVSALRALWWLSLLAAPVLVGCASSGNSSTPSIAPPSGTSIGVGSGTLAVTPNAVTIHPGDQNIPVMVSVAGSTYTGPINVTLTGLPSGISVSALTLTNGGSGTLNISASVSADQGAFYSDTPPASPESTSDTNSVAVVGVEGSALIKTPMALTVSISNPSYAPAPSQINLPIVTINTSGQPVVSKTVDVPGTITITSANGQTSYLPNSSDTDNTAVIHVHGHSTTYMPKLAYEFKLTTSLDLLDTMGLVCPYVTSKGKATCDKSKTYVLLANYDDKALLRDWSASALANAIPIGNGYLNSPADSPSPSGTSTLMPWASHSLFVELYLNGVYEGNYQLTEKVNVDSHRININELAETDITDDITGGYLMEIDHYEDEALYSLRPKGSLSGSRIRTSLPIRKFLSRHPTFPTMWTARKRPYLPATLRILRSAGAHISTRPPP